MSQAPLPFNETPEAARARRRRSWAIALGCVAFVILVFVITVIKLSQNAIIPQRY